MPQGLIVFLRATFSFISLLVLTRIMGKSQVSHLTFFDYVNGITIGSIAATLAVDLSRESLPTLIGLMTYSLWVIVLTIVELNSKTLRRLIDGKPTIVIQNGKILGRNLRDYGYTIDNLRMLLRLKDVFSLSEVEYAIIEPNGQLSVLLKSQKLPITPSDLQIPTNYKGLTIDLINDGQVIQDNLNLLGLTSDWLQNTLQEKNIAINQVFYAELDSSGELYYDLYQDPHHRKELNNG